MPKPIILLIYQDCYDCDSSKSWHDKIQESAADLGILIKYTPYNTPGAKEIILEAHEQGIEVPFLSDGKCHSHKLEDLVEVPTTGPSKKSPKPRKNKEVKNGATSKAD